MRPSEACDGADHAVAGNAGSPVSARSPRRRRRGRALRPRALDVLLEQALEVGKAGKAEDLGEAHQRRGLHAGLLGDLADGAERDIARVLPQEDGDLAQALGEMHGAGRQDGAQFLIGLRLGVAKRGERSRLLAASPTRRTDRPPSFAAGLRAPLMLTGTSALPHARTATHPNLLPGSILGPGTSPKARPGHLPIYKMKIWKLRSKFGMPPYAAGLRFCSASDGKDIGSMVYATTDKVGARSPAGRHGRRRPQCLHRRRASARHAARRPDRAGRRRAVVRPGERRRLGRGDRHRARPQLCRLPRDGARRGGAAGRHRGGRHRHAQPSARADRHGLPRGRHRRDLRQAAVDDAGRGRGAGGAGAGAQAPFRRHAQQHRLRHGAAGARDGGGGRARPHRLASTPPTSRTG